MLLTTARLTVRELGLDDLDAVHDLLDVDLRMADLDRADRGRWLTWTGLDNEFRRRAFQPPYGEYGIELRDGGALIGLVGLVPCLGPFGLVPGFGGPPDVAVAQVGLFWAVATAQQRRGYAVEAARALTAWAFDALGVGRIVATTERDNVASAAVMRALGMTVGSNPASAPFWLEVLGWVDRPGPAPEWPRHPG